MDGNALNIIALAGRDSTKTVGLSVIDLLALLHDARSAAHIAMIRTQASRAREYIEKYIMSSPLMKPMVIKQNTKEIRLNILGEEVGLEILSLDPKQTQGLHSALVSYDELASSTDPVKLKAYKDSSGIPGSSRKGKPAVVIKITSRQTGDTIPEVEIKNTHKNKLKIRKWTTFDCMQRCLPERSGTISAPVYIDLIKGVTLKEDAYLNLPVDQRMRFKLAADVMDGCHKCPLMMYCQGKARHQTSDSVLLRDYDTVVHKVLNSGSHDWILAQLMSLEPSKEGLVYYEFQRETHVVSWDFMWERLTGEKPTASVTKELFVSKAKRSDCQFYAGIDWGWSSPSTCVAMCVDSRDNVYVLDAIGRTYMQPAEFIEVIKSEIHEKYGIDLFMPDSEDQAAVQQMRTADLPVIDIDKSAGTVKAGISTVKRFLRVPGTNAETKLLISSEIPASVSDTPGLIEEFGMYKKKIDASGRILDDENPVKGFDHFLDSVRYCIYWLFGKSMTKAVFADAHKSGSPGAPLPNLPIDQLARAAGVSFNDNRSEFDKMGEQPKKPDDDPNGGSSGGGGVQFVWT
jgi:hypothetical protein